MKSKTNKNELNKYLFESNNFYLDQQQNAYKNEALKYKNGHNQRNQYNFYLLDNENDENCNKNNYQRSSMDISKDSILNGNYEHNDQQDGDNEELDFPQDNGRSIQFSGGMSLMQSKGYELDSSNHFPPKHPKSLAYQDLLRAKQKQQQRLNELIQMQKNQHDQQISKKICLIQGLNKHIEDLEEQNKKKKKELERAIEKYKNIQRSNEQLIQQLEKANTQKQQIFDLLSEKGSIIDVYHTSLKQLQQQDTIKNQALQQQAMQIQVLREEIRSLTGNQKGLTDFSGVGLSKNKSSDNYTLQIEQLKRQNKNLEKQLQQLKNRYNGQIENLKYSMKNMEGTEQQNKRKLAGKDRKIRQLQDELKYASQELGELKLVIAKSVEGAEATKSRLNTQAKQLMERDNKIRQLQARVKSLHEDCKGKQQKIKELILQVTQKNKMIQSINKNYNQLKAKSEGNDKWVHERQTQVDKKDKIINILRNEKEAAEKSLTNAQGRFKKEIQSIRDQLQEANKQLQKIEREKRDKELALKQYKSKYQSLNRDYKKKLEENSKKSTNQSERYEKLEEMIADQQEELQKRQETINSLTKDIQQMKKKVGDNRELSNKLKILEARLTMERAFQSEDTFDMENQKIQFLESALRDKQDQIKALKSKCSSQKSMVSLLQVERFQQQIAQRDTFIEQLQRQIEFKQKSLQFLHNKLLEIQKEKIEHEAERKRMQSSFYNDMSYQGEAEEYRKQLEQRVIQLQQKEGQYETRMAQYEQQIKSYKKKLRDKQQVKYYNPEKDARFEIAQLKTRIKELNNMLLNRQKMISPEGLSQSQTVDLLVKIIRRVNTSSEMLKLLGANSQFKKSLVSMERQLNL